jgi:Ni/Fe-hydrogenase subunit HybB-like protein
LSASSDSAYSPLWIVIVAVIGGIAVGVCFMIAGQKADHAAICVETPKAEAT